MKYNKKILKELKQFEFIKWDRYTQNCESSVILTQCYGWIYRDNKKRDFVYFEFWDDIVAIFCTSSIEYSEKIGENLGIETHIKCEKIPL